MDRGDVSVWGTFVSFAMACTGRRVGGGAHHFFGTPPDGFVQSDGRSRLLDKTPWWVREREPLQFERLVFCCLSPLPSVLRVEVTLTLRVPPPPPPAPDLRSALPEGDLAIREKGMQDGQSSCAEVKRCA